MANSSFRKMGRHQWRREAVVESGGMPLVFYQLCKMLVPFVMRHMQAGTGVEMMLFIAPDSLLQSL